MCALSKAACGRTDRFVVIYFCFLAWLHWKTVSFVKEQGDTGLVAVAGGQAYVLHSPSFWALAIIAFGVASFLFRSQ